MGADILSLSSLKGLLTFWPFVSTLLGNGYFFVITATILTLFLLGTGLLVKYTPNLLHDIKNVTNNDLPVVGIKLWMACILLIPIFFDAGPLWFVLWWFIALWGYINKAEKRVAFVFISIIFMSSWISHVGAGFITYSHTQANREIFNIDHDIGTTQDTLAIASWTQKHPDDAEPLNTKALIEMKKGNHTAAVNLLSRSLDLEPNNFRFYNHLGIALVGVERNTEASKAFGNAIALDPDNIVYHYNLSRLYQLTYNLYDAERAIQKASSIDPQKVRHFLDYEEKNQDNRFIMEQVPVTRLLARQMKQSGDLKVVADSLWHMAFGIFTRNGGTFISLAVILMLFLLSHLPEDKFTKRCNRCGNLYYSGTMSKSGYPMCLQCHWIETKAKKQMNSILHTKAEEIKKYRINNTLNTSKLELILPGLGSLAGNKTTKGILRMFTFSAAFILILTGGQFIYSTIPTGIDLTGFMRVFGVLIAALLYWRAYKSPPIRYGV
jgi:tetratricopeptide (TPR) repeat protein